MEGLFGFFFVLKSEQNKNFNWHFVLASGYLSIPSSSSTFLFVIRGQLCAKSNLPCGCLCCNCARRKGTDEGHSALFFLLVAQFLHLEQKVCVSSWKLPPRTLLIPSSRHPWHCLRAIYAAAESVRGIGGWKKATPTTTIEYAFGIWNICAFTKCSRMIYYLEPMELLRRKISFGMSNDDDYDSKDDRPTPGNCGNERHEERRRRGRMTMTRH